MSQTLTPFELEQARKANLTLELQMLEEKMKSEGEKMNSVDDCQVSAAEEEEEDDDDDDKDGDPKLATKNFAAQVST